MDLYSEHFIEFLQQAQHPFTEEIIAQFKLYFISIAPKPEVKKVEFVEAVEIIEPMLEPILEDIEEVPKEVKKVEKKKKKKKIKA